MPEDLEKIILALKGLKLPEGWDFISNSGKFEVFKVPQGEVGYRPNCLRVYLDKEDGTATVTIGIGWEFDTDPDADSGTFPEVY